MSSAFAFTIDSFFACEGCPPNSIAASDRMAWQVAYDAFQVAHKEEIHAENKKRHEACLRKDPRDGRTYYQGDYVLKPWEMKFQSAEGDYMDFDLVKNWEAFPWKDFNWDRDSMGNYNIFDHLRPFIRSALARKDITKLKPAYLRFWYFPGDDVPLLHSGEVAFAVSEFRHDVAAHGKIEAGVRFLQKMVEAHTASEELGYNWHNASVREWVRDGWRSLIGPCESEAFDYERYDANGQGVDGTEICLYDMLLETKEDIDELVRRTSQWPDAAGIASGLREAFEYYADQRE